MKFSVKQIIEMKHALGLNYEKAPFRNYYNTRKKCPEWNELCENGFATMNEYRGNTTYFVTEKGKETIMKILSE